MTLGCAGTDCRLDVDARLRALAEEREMDVGAGVFSCAPYDDFAVCLLHSSTDPGPTPSRFLTSAGTEICPCPVSFDWAMHAIPTGGLLR